MEEFEINSITDLLNLVKINAIGSNNVYRGHSDKDWKLVPSLFRIDPFDARITSWEHLEHIIICDFKRKYIQYYPKKIQCEADLLCLAQHIGIPTRLIDWSENPLIALFFAIENLNDIQSDSCIWHINYMWEHISIRQDFSDNDILVYKPILLDQRITNQKGCFTIHRLPEGRNEYESDFLSNSPQVLKLSKYIIPNKFKSFLKKELSDVGIDYLTIYPDIYGLGKNIYWKIEKRDIDISYETYKHINKINTSPNTRA